MSWVPLGPSVVRDGPLGYFVDNPGPVAGRVSAIAFGPVGGTTAIYVGAASGGLWRSLDDGRHWTPLTDDQVSLSVGAIAVSADGQTICVGTGEDNGHGAAVFAGAGLLISTDGGAHFSVEPDPQADQTLLGRHISAVSIDPRDSRRMFVATDFGVWETRVESTGTRSWRMLTTQANSEEPGHATDMEVDWRDPAQPVVYAVFDNLTREHALEGVFRTDAAGFLVSITPPRFKGGRALLARTLDTLYVGADTYDTGLDVRVSTNGGGEWMPMPDLHRLPEPDNLYYKFVLEVDPAQPGTVFYGDTRLWRYTPHKSWHLVSEPTGSYRGIHVDQHALAFHPTDHSIWVGNDGGVWVSRDHGEGFSSGDRGERFAPRNRGLQNLQAYTVSQHPTAPAALLIGTQDNGLQRYLGHPAWQMVEGGDGAYTAIDPNASHRWYGGGQSGSPERAGGVFAVQRSDEAGARRTFEVVVDGLDGSLPFYVPFVIDPSQEGVLYAALDTLFRSTNRGRRWHQVPGTEGEDEYDGIRALAVAPSNSNVVYLVRDSRTCTRLELQPDGSWQKWHGDAKAGRFTFDDCRVMVVDPQDPYVVYIAIGTWDGPRFDPAPAHLFRGTRGADGGLHIEPLGHVADLEIATGHTPAFTLTGDRNQINALVIDPEHPTHLYAGCDVGVFRSTDAGASWVRWNIGLPNVVVSDLQFHKEARLVRASTLGRGVWERRAEDPPVVPPTPQVDIYVRDYLADVGRTPSLGQTKHPVKFDTIRWTDGIDIKVDTDDRFVGGFKTPSSTVDYAGGAADYLGFEALGSDDVRPRTRSRVYVQVHNRGPDAATDVHVRAYFAPKGASGFPDVPAQFWTAFPGDPPDLGAWTPLGPAQTIAELGAAAPEVVRFDFDFPSLPDAIGILVAISTAHDPLPDLPRAVEDAVRADKHVALKEVSVGMPSYQIVLIVLGMLGVVAAAVAVAESD